MRTVVGGAMPSEMMSGLHGAGDTCLGPQVAELVHRQAAGRATQVGAGQSQGAAEVAGHAADEGAVRHSDAWSGRGVAVSNAAGPYRDAGAPLGWRTDAQHSRVERIAQRGGQSVQHQSHRACEAFRGCVSRRRANCTLSGRMGPPDGVYLAGAAPVSCWAGAECVRSGPRPA